MKLRRTAATAVAVAAVAPAALLAAPAAYATEGAGEKLYSCYDVSTAYGDYEQKSIKLTQTDTDGPVVRGGGWRSFRATVTNISSKDVSPLSVSVYAWRQVEDEDPVLGRFIEFQYKAGQTGKWTPVDSGASGRFVTNGVLKAGKSVTYELRLRAPANTPKHMTWGDVSVQTTFVDHYRFPDGRVVPCTAGPTGQNGITIVDPAAKPTPGATKPGTTPGGATTPRPGPTSPAPTPPRPTGSPTPPVAPSTPRTGASSNVVGVSDQTTSRASGNLAQTGSSDALPTVALIGGAAVVTGGAAVLIARRRRTN
ncbi:LPXTG cell wall anchor domain-containing protein [Streptomyces sp. NPDC018045]|uniref:LPXTG cell wall anchor domain-containing protein n=1 Tax=Streptomyces sp. NPDC018045 TaxID=3365037 RepID=UPI0037B90642